MPDRDLKLNSLSRFSKQSPRLVLEEYSHCEVPAGCGGVVLRWRKAQPPIPMQTRFGWGNGRMPDRKLDDQYNLFHPKLPVDYGTHVISMIATDVNPSFAIVLMVGELNADYLRILQPEGETLILSSADGSWRYTLDEPADDWRTVEYDDSAWRPMVEKPVENLERHREWDSKIVDRGAIPIGIDMGEPESNFFAQVKQLLSAKNTIDKLFIRKTFTITEAIQDDEETR